MTLNEDNNDLSRARRNLDEDFAAAEDESKDEDDEEAEEEVNQIHFRPSLTKLKWIIIKHKIERNIELYRKRK